jgi:uncharacterized glyoxalase superfamily protein PhnB
MDTIYPVLRYDDAHAAIEFIEKAFGFERTSVFEGENGSVSHAELTRGDAVLGLSSTGQGDTRFDQCAGKSSIYLAVDDPDARYEQAKAAGAKVERELEDMDYGSREFTVRDPEGNLWSFGTYRPGASTASES